MKKKLNLDAGLLAAAAQSKQRAATETKTPRAEAHGLVQFNVRINADARERIKNAADIMRISERALIEQMAASLPEPTPPPKLNFRVEV